MTYPPNKFAPQGDPFVRPRGAATTPAAQLDENFAAAAPKVSEENYPVGSDDAKSLAAIAFANVVDGLGQLGAAAVDLQNVSPYLGLTNLLLQGPANSAETFNEGVPSTGEFQAIRNGSDAAASTDTTPDVYWQRIEGANTDTIIYAPGMPARAALTGNPFPLAKLYTRVTGTTTPLAAYLDAAYTQLAPNPVISDAFGAFPVLYAPTSNVYRIRVETAGGALVAQTDGVVPNYPLRRIWSLSYVRKADAIGYAQGHYVHLEDYSADGNNQTVAGGAFAHNAGFGSTWADYRGSLLRNFYGKGAASELDVGNFTGVDFPYDPTGPLLIPHNKALHIYSSPGSRNSFARSLLASTSSQLGAGEWVSPFAVRDVLWDVFATPRKGIVLRGASVDGLGVTPAGTGIDLSIGSFGQPGIVAVTTGSIAPATFVVTASVKQNVLDVTAVTSGVVTVGATVSGTGVAGGVTVLGQANGTAGGVGKYFVSSAQSTAVASTTVTGVYGLATITAVASGALLKGYVLQAPGIALNTVILEQRSGTAGSTGTYVVSPSQTLASTTLTAVGGNAALDLGKNALAFGPVPGQDITYGGRNYAVWDDVNKRLALVIAGGAALQIAGGSLLPGANNAQALGVNGLAWTSCTTVSGYNVGSNQVVGPRGAAVADAVAAAGAPTQAEFNAFVTQFNAWLARARTHGLIAP